jgi:hypothetical protein
MKLGELTIEEAAKQAAGNWKDFRCFVWWREREIDDAANWTIIYTHNRDSGLLDQSNAAVIAKLLRPLAEGDDPDVVFESHSHWAVGHVNGFSLRVFRNEQITEAFRKYHELAEQLEAYPVLDESDYSNREYEATVQNIEDAAWRLKSDYELPEGWPEEVYRWLSDNEESEIENADDQGGYPSIDALRRAFAALGFEPAEDSAAT